MAQSKLKQIESALKKIISEGKALSLGEDTFLTGALDSSYKICGFINNEKEILVVSSESSRGFPINDMDKEDVDYIFELSSPNILKKIKDNKYKIFPPMAQEIELKDKFVIAYDTICDGWNCMMTEDDDDDAEHPVLFDSEDEAFHEIFDGNHSMLESHLRNGQLEELNEGVTSEMVEEMGKILASGDVTAMRKFMNEHPQCDDSQEWVEPAETFIMNRKAFLTSEGIVITGTKLVI